MKRHTTRLGLAIAVCFSLVNPLFIQPSSAAAVAIDPPETNPYIVPGKVIVKMKENMQQSSVNGFESYSAKGAFQSNPEYRIMDVPENSTVSKLVQELSNRPDIEYAEPVFINKAFDLPSSPAISNELQAASLSQPNDPEYINGRQWGMSVTDITYAWDKAVDRSSVIIAIVDTGVDGLHEDLQGHLVNGYNAINNSPIPPSSDIDSSGHGTMVAGIAAAASDNGKGIAGVAGGSIATGAKIMPVKVLDNTGYGTSDITARGIRWAADHGAKVINLSLGRPRFDDLQTDLYSRVEHDAIRYAVSKGATVVAASGNESNHWISGQPANTVNDNKAPAYQVNVAYPAALPETVAVGAVTNVAGQLYLADFSNIDSTLDVVAPGADILSTNTYSGYSKGSGTSFSSPFVAGLAALALAADPALTPKEVLTVLKASASLDGLKSPVNSVITQAQYFGAGLVNGKRLMDKPRLKLSHTSGALDALGELGFKLDSADYKGTVTQIIYSSVNINVNKYDFNLGYFVPLRKDVVPSTALHSITESLTDIGAYEIYADDANNSFVPSNYITAVIFPEPPLADKTSGSYSGSVQVSLGSTTEGAAIYYTLDGSEPDANDLYSGPFSITKSSTLKAVAVKNNFASQTSSYTYTLVPSTTTSTGRGGGGGGGGGGFIPSTPDDSQPIVVKADNALLKKKLEEANTTSVTIDATTGSSSASVRQIEFGAELLKLAADMNKSIVIDAGRQTFELPPGTVSVNDNSATVTLAVSRSAGETSLSNKPAQAKNVSFVYDFSLTVGTERVTRFDKPVSIQWKLGAIQAQLAKIGVYSYNESGQSWDYIGGKISPEGTIAFTTDHFSQYAVMEYNKTFDDMTQHWAKDEVELLASRYIVTGLSDTTFVPEQKLTRAEFAALLVRALGVKTIDTAGQFQDVKPTDWFHDVVYQAYGAGLIEGTNAVEFAPDQPITREQMAVMMMRAYRIATGKQAGDAALAQEVKFTDDAQTGGWAKDSVRLSSGIGLMSGFPDGTFKPSDTANRGQAAVVIKRLLDLTQQ